jgi:DNA repair photolyase
MNIIYEPAGKAREYSPLAANIYTGCGSDGKGCQYCFAPAMRRMSREQYFSKITPRKNVLELFEKDCKQIQGSKKNVQFCFMTDPYNREERKLRLVRKCLELCLEYKIPVSILTKRDAVLDDLELFRRFGKHIKVGFTLTFDNEIDSKNWEPGASLPQDRLAALKILYKNGIRTWASLEPVIVPLQSLSMIRKSLKYVDLYKVGKLNNFMGIDKEINWSSFLIASLVLLRENKKDFYIKKDLIDCSDKKIKLLPKERDMDIFNVVPF